MGDLMAYYRNPIVYPSGLLREDTAKINENFTELPKVFKDNDPTTYIVKNAINAENAINAQNAINADMLDGCHADLFMALSMFFGELSVEGECWVEIDEVGE